MAIQNQGYRKDLNLDETTNDSQALNNLAGAGIAGDVRIIQNNLRNTSSIACTTFSNGFFTFPDSIESIFTNDDVVSVGTTVTFGSVTLQPSTNYFICNSDGESQFKISSTSSDSSVGVSTVITNGTPSPTTFDIIRKNPVHKENLLNYIPPEIQDAVGEFSWTSDLNGTFDSSTDNIDTAKYFIGRKYRNGSDLTTDREVKYEGVVTSSDPANLNQSTAGLENPKSPGVFIGDTRAFSSNDQPWTETGASLQTESEEVSVGDLTFNGDIKIEGIDPVDQSSNVSPASFTHKLPVVINGITYFVLLGP
tara:strand:+ start:1326 stop:2249 length:924 start_codon:yes stop_codon:yes gene_type:complete